MLSQKKNDGTCNLWLSGRQVLEIKVRYVRKGMSKDER